MLSKGCQSKPQAPKTLEIQESSFKPQFTRDLCLGVSTKSQLNPLVSTNVNQVFRALSISTLME